MITAEELRKVLDYNPETGVFTWKRLSPKIMTLGTPAGCQNSSGYLVIHIQNRLYLAHRLAWLYVYGVWPTKQLDHINRVKADNRIANLREVTNRENSLNMAAGKSGFKGVAWANRECKWFVRLCHQGRRSFLGYYNDPSIASLHYQWARLCYDREFF